MKTLISGTLVFLFFVLLSCGGDNSVQLNNSSSVPPDTQYVVSTEKMRRKEALMRKLTGEHILKSISGSIGANTMVDYVLENGKWLATGSSISGGMRESYGIDLSDEEMKKLKSMKIIVDDDLSVSITMNGKAYFTAPYIEEGIAYSLKKSPGEYSSYMSDKLLPSSTFLDDYLYFLVKDNISENEIGPLDITGVNADALVIKYNIKSNQFEVNLFYGDCCDNSTYIFK